MSMRIFTTSIEYQILSALELRVAYVQFLLCKRLSDDAGSDVLPEFSACLSKVESTLNDAARLLIDDGAKYDPPESLRSIAQRLASKAQEVAMELDLQRESRHEDQP